MRDVALVVVGAGPAGRAAAAAAARLGVETLLVDDQPPPPPGETGTAAERAASAGVEYLPSHSAWGVFPGRVVGLADGSSTWLVRAGQLILATGAGDACLAFPGSHLHGVLGALDALQRMQSTGTLDAHRLLVLGSGNLALAVAQRALRVGIAVAGLVEPTEHILGDAALALHLQQAAVPAFCGCTIRSAEGTAEAVTRVRLARVNAGMLGQPHTDVLVEADAVCLAVGRQPAIELPVLAGCPIGYDPQRGGHYALPTDGVQVAGDVAGAWDVDVLLPERAAASGTRAAIQAARALGYPTPDAPPPPPIDRAALPPAAASTWQRLTRSVCTDETILCPCEVVTRGRVLQAIDAAEGDPNDTKRLSRAGMGVCQGRRCHALVADLIAATLGVPASQVPLPTVRPPVRPLPLAALATEDIEPPPASLAACFLSAERRLAEDARAGRLGPLALIRFRRAAEQAAYRAAQDGLGRAETEAVARDLEELTRRQERRHP